MHQVHHNVQVCVRAGKAAVSDDGIRVVTVFCPVCVRDRVLVMCDRAGVLHKSLHRRGAL